MSRLYLQPITLTEAKRFVRDWHRHLDPPTGGAFAVAVNDGEKVVGVAIVGRPNSRVEQAKNPYLCEITRCAVRWKRHPHAHGKDASKMACSMLYRAAWRAARAMGYRRLNTRILFSEDGTSLKAAGFQCDRYEDGTPVPHGGGKWDRPSRPRVDTHPTEQKQLWWVEAA